MKDGFYILILVLAFSALYLNHQFGFLTAEQETLLYHVELVLMLCYILYRIWKE